MESNGEYKFLKPKRGSRYKQLFFGRIRAEVLYRETVSSEPLTSEEVASFGGASDPRHLLCAVELERSGAATGNEFHIRNHWR